MRVDDGHSRIGGEHGRLVGSTKESAASAPQASRAVAYARCGSVLEAYLADRNQVALLHVEVRTNTSERPDGVQMVVHKT